MTKTPQPQYPSLAAALGVPVLYLKREDLHPYGSHKGRSIPLMIYNYVRDDVRQFAISSSGNAALAAMMTVRDYNKSTDEPITLDIYVGKNIPDQKLKILQSNTSVGVTIQQVGRPKQTAFQAAKDGHTINLRQSTDDTALFGYHELAFELAEIPNLASVFVPTSSGTTAQGIAEGFDETEVSTQIHIVQTTSCHPIISTIPPYSLRRELRPNGGDKGGYPGQTKEEPSIATAIVDTVAHRKARVAEIVKETQGAGWIVTNDEITEVIALVKQHTGLVLSPNGVLGIAAAKKATERGWEFEGAVVCVVGGM